MHYFDSQEETHSFSLTPEPGVHFVLCFLASGRAAHDSRCEPGWSLVPGGVELKIVVHSN